MRDPLIANQSFPCLHNGLKASCLLSHQLSASSVPFSRNPLKPSYPSAGLCLFAEVRIRLNSTSSLRSSPSMWAASSVQNPGAGNLTSECIPSVTSCWAFLAAHTLLSSCGSRAPHCGASRAVALQAHGLPGFIAQASGCGWRVGFVASWHL